MTHQEEANQLLERIKCLTGDPSYHIQKQAKGVMLMKDDGVSVTMRTTLPTLVSQMDAYRDGVELGYSLGIKNGSTRNYQV